MRISPSLRALADVSVIILLCPLIVKASTILSGSTSQVNLEAGSVTLNYPQERHTFSTTIIDLLSTSSHHDILLHLLQRCKLVPSVNLMQGLTLFAPTDDAWESWAKEKEHGPVEADARLAEIILRQQTENVDALLADNILFDTRQLLLFHMLNYTIPLEHANQLDGLNRHPTDRWLARNVSTETTLLYPSRHHHPAGHLPPPHPPWSPEGGTGILGGHGQQMRLFFREDQRAGPSRVQVDLDGQGGAAVWTGWAGNRTADRHRPARGDKYRVGSNGVLIGIDRVLSPPDGLGMLNT